MIGIEFNWIDIIGFIAGAILLWGMFKKTIIPIRLSLVCGNIFFIIFGYLSSSDPTLITHACLLPLNSIRLFQVWRLVNHIRSVKSENLNLDLLLPFMNENKKMSGEMLFCKGDPADQMIIIKKGFIRLEELGISCGPDTILGEVAAFSPKSLRTATAIAKTDCQFYTINNEYLLQVFYQNPEIGMFLIRTVVSRLLSNWQNAETRAKAMLT